MRDPAAQPEHGEPRVLQGRAHAPARARGEHGPLDLDALSGERVGGPADEGPEAGVLLARVGVGKEEHAHALRVVVRAGAWALGGATTASPSATTPPETL